MKGATSIQERLWELRKDKGLNLEELSKLTGISKSALGSYEKENYLCHYHCRAAVDRLHNRREFLYVELLLDAECQNIV